MSVFYLNSRIQLLMDPGVTCSVCDAVNQNIKREVKEYEDRYRGRELPGFINYKIFELMVKEQIKQLEEPAVRKLKDIGGK